jgi:hypothetical protein
MLIAQKWKIEVGGEDVDADEAEVVAVSVVLPLPRSGTGDQTLTNMGEKDAQVATTENIAGVEHLAVEIVSRGEEGDEGDKDKGKDKDKDQTTTIVMCDPLLIMALTHSPHLRPRRILRTQRRLSLLRHRTHSLLRPLLHRMCIRLL